MPIKRLSKSELNALARAAEILTECYSMFGDEKAKEAAQAVLDAAKAYTDDKENKS